jgi:choline dehydrogenase-like flavoprotein
MRATGDPRAVLDLELQIRDVADLCVVDASVFPTVTAVNPVVTRMIVAERAAKLISGETRVEYFWVSAFR